MIRTETAALTPAAAGRLLAALADALAGGPPVLPLPDDAPVRPLLDAAHPDLPTGGVAALVPTSGSTGAPKLVELSAGALTASAHATHAVLGGPGRWLLALPPTHVAGLQVLCRSLLAGLDPLVAPGPGFTAAGFTAASRELTGPRRYTALVPTQLRRVLADPAATAALAGYDGVLVGGAATPPALLDAARAAGVALRTTYGMSETAGGCVYDGVPLAGVDVVLDAGGRVALGGPTVARGYRGLPGPTAAAFVGGRFVTADLGRWSADGRLEVLGRSDDVVVTGGVNVHPLAVEAVLARQPGVRDVVVGGVPDPEWGSAVTAWVVGPADPAALRAAVRAVLGPAAVPRTVRAVDAIPLLPSGKPDRRALVEAASR